MLTSDVKRLMLSVLPALIPLAALADSRAQRYYYEDIVQPFFILDPAHPGMYRNQRPGSRDSLFTAVKPADGFRVFVIGGSIASLLQSTDAKDELARALEAALPTKKVEVVNCGMAGYESFREALVEQEILEYSPDLIVFLTGHNEGIASAPIPIWIMRAQERLSRLSAFRRLAKSLQPDRSDKVKYSDAASDARDAVFARNLGDNLRHARESGAAAAVVIPPRNYREPAEVGATPYDPAFVAGWLSFLRGDAAAARASWLEAVSAGGRGRIPDSARMAFAWGFIARSEEKLGLWDEARASFERAAKLERGSICGEVCQGILRRTAEKEGAFLVEADRMFRSLASPRMPGMETFSDRMHWKPRFNCLMSSEIIDAVRAQPKFAGLPWDEASVRALRASCAKPGGAVSDEDALRTLSYVLLEMSWPDRRRLSTVAVFYLQEIYRRRPEWFADVPALAKRTQNPQTRVYGIAMAPDAVVVPNLHWHIGEVRLLEKDYAGAARDFSKALELEPKLNWARLSLAAAEALRGDKQRAGALLREAVERSAEDSRREDLLAAAVVMEKTLGIAGPAGVAASDPDFWIKKASDARKAEALEALARARSLSPRPDQLREIGHRYRALNEPGKFLEVFDALALAYPGDAGLRVSQAESLFELKRDEAGLEALARAEALSPDAAFRRLIAGLRAAHPAPGIKKDRIR